MKTPIEIPEISEVENETLEDDIAEFRCLNDLLEPENSPEHGWASWLIAKIESRITHVARAIAGKVCAEKDADTEKERKEKNGNY